MNNLQILIFYLFLDNDQSIGSPYLKVCEMGRKRSQIRSLSQQCCEQNSCNRGVPGTLTTAKTTTTTTTTKTTTTTTTVRAPVSTIRTDSTTQSTNPPFTTTEHTTHHHNHHHHTGNFRLILKLSKKIMIVYAYVCANICYMVCMYTEKNMYIMNYVHTLNFFQNLIVLKHKAYLINSKLLSFTASNSSL